MSRFEFIADNMVRLDKYIAQQDFGITRSHAQLLIDGGHVTVNGVAVKSKYLPKIGDAVVITLPEAQVVEGLPQDIPLDIVYEDKHLLVVNKSRGMVVHPAAGNTDGTLVNALLYHCSGQLSEINGVIRPGIVHRIDKDTTGLLMVAKDDAAHLGLSEQIKEHSLTRKYMALVHNNIKSDQGTIRTTIGRHPSDRKKMSVHSKNGRDAVTHYTVLERFIGYTLAECRLETGRTHQIRVHMNNMGNPVVGDKVYGVKKEQFTLDGQLLHAHTLGFIHPITKDYMEFTAPVPQDFEKIINILSKKGRHE